MIIKHIIFIGFTNTRKAVDFSTKPVKISSKPIKFSVKPIKFIVQ